MFSIGNNAVFNSQETLDFFDRHVVYPSMPALTLECFDKLLKAANDEGGKEFKQFVRDCFVPLLGSYYDFDIAAWEELKLSI